MIRTGLNHCVDYWIRASEGELDFYCREDGAWFDEVWTNRIEVWANRFGDHGVGCGLTGWNEGNGGKWGVTSTHLCDIQTFKDTRDERG
jgi:hypothetical protein